jgi:hypothetical protein
MKMSETVDRATVARPEMITVRQAAARGVLPERLRSAILGVTSRTRTDVFSARTARNC